MSTSTSPTGSALPTLPVQAFRLDVPLHDLLQKDPHPPLARVEHDPRTSLALPSPVIPQHPELLHESDAADISAHQAVLETGKRHWPSSKVMKSMRGWMLPYFKSRILPGEFQPIIAYLFTEWKCNPENVAYCYSAAWVMKWLCEQTMNNFQEVTGSFE
jgi:hypothetical protein